MTSEAANAQSTRHLLEEAYRQMQVANSVMREQLASHETTMRMVRYAADEIAAPEAAA